jgi:hypothetical protein
MLSLAQKIAANGAVKIITEASSTTAANFAVDRRKHRRKKLRKDSRGASSKDRR